MRRLFFLILSATLLFAAACSDQNAPLTSFHGDDPLGEHAGLARADEARCRACHGEDYTGGSSGASCFACHAGGPPFSLHPPEWGSIIGGHQSFANGYHWTFCATSACHGTQLEGGDLDRPGPGCFAAGCHDESSPVTHALPYIDPGDHGPAGLAAQDTCFNCHGDLPDLFTGGLVADLEIVGNPLGNCTLCHPGAPPFNLHPPQWDSVIVDHQGFADDHHWTLCATADCHGIQLEGGDSLLPGPSCFAAGCHDESPPVTHGLPYTDPDNHGPAGRDGQATCFNCHGDLPNLFTGGFVSDAVIVNNFLGDCTLCHSDAEAHPTQWSGETNPDPIYPASHREADPVAWSDGCALCHDILGAGGGPIPDSPGCYSGGFTNADGITSGCHENGPGMIHPPGQPWMDKTEPDYHGNSDLDCAACHDVELFCWECHFGEDGSKVPPGVTTEHGDGEDHRKLENYQSTCNNCHDTNRLYGNSPGGCHDCHDD